MGTAKRWLRWRERSAPYVLLAPYLFMLVVFFGYALVRVVYFSFTRYNLFTRPRWVGIQNYLNLFRDPTFGRALDNSLSFMVVVTLAQTAFALLLAVLVHQRLRGIRFFRAAFFVPSIASSVVVTLIFMWFFQRQGLINYVLTWLKVNAPLILTFLLAAALSQILLVYKEKRRRLPVSPLEPSYLVLSLLFGGIAAFVLAQAGVIAAREGVRPVDIIWLNTRKQTLEWAGPLAFPIPLGAIMIMNTWTTAPTFMLLFLAGLQDIPRELYEAASVDGAKGWNVFRYITLPQLGRITFLVMTLGLIGTIQMFDQVAVMGDQAPIESVITLAYYVYRNAFPSSAVPDIGMASAAAIFLGLLTLIVVLIQKKIAKQ